VLPLPRWGELMHSLDTRTSRSAGLRLTKGTEGQGQEGIEKKGGKGRGLTSEGSTDWREQRTEWTERKREGS